MESVSPPLWDGAPVGCCKKAPHAAHATSWSQSVALHSQYVDHTSGSSLDVCCRWSLQPQARNKTGMSFMGENMKFQVLLVGLGEWGKVFLQSDRDGGTVSCWFCKPRSSGSWEGKPLNYHQISKITKHQISKSELRKVCTAWASVVIVFFIGFGQVFLCSQTPKLLHLYKENSLFL